MAACVVDGWQVATYNGQWKLNMRPNLERFQLKFPIHNDYCLHMKLHMPRQFRFAPHSIQQRGRNDIEILVIVYGMH